VTVFGLKRAALLGRSEEGGVAIEFAIIGTLLVFGAIATLELARALHLRGEMAYAADVAERQVLMDPEASDSAVEAAVRSAFRGDGDLLTIDVGEETLDGMTFRTLSLDYPASLVAPTITTRDLGLDVARRTPIEWDGGS
jgi:TadE-like protein